MISSKCKGDFFPTKQLEALDAQTCLQAQLGEFARADEAREKNWASKSSLKPVTWGPFLESPGGSFRARNQIFKSKSKE